MKQNRKLNLNKVWFSFKSIYLKLTRINDSPQRIALGFGLGAFLGILPGTGPIAALFLSTLLRVNRASALLGSLLTNTWLSFVTFFLSIKLGAGLMRLNWQEVYNNWNLVIKDFHWQSLFKLSIFEAVLPVIIGYFVVALSFGIVVYLMILVLFIFTKHENKSRTYISQ